MAHDLTPEDARAVARILWQIQQRINAAPAEREEPEPAR